MDNEILDGMARALFVTAYADHCEECEGCKMFKGHKKGHPRPGGGENWEDYAPPTSKEARDTALILWGKLEQANGRSMWTLLASAATADGTPPYANDWVDYPAGYQAEFGGDLAMQALGHGVSWFDDHAEFPLEIPHIEFSL